MPPKRWRQAAVWAYSGGYYAYLTATIYLAWHSLGWASIMGMYGLYQSFIALGWPIWLLTSHWPLLPV